MSTDPFETSSVTIEEAIKDFDTFGDSLRQTPQTSQSILASDSPDITKDINDAISESLDVAVAVLDENLNYLYIGDSVYRGLGLTREDIKPGDHLSDMHNIMESHGLISQDQVDNSSLSAKRLLGANGKNSQIVKFKTGEINRLTRKTLANGWIVSQSTDITDLASKDEMLQQALSLGKAGYWIFDFETKTYELSDSLQLFFSDEEKDQLATQGVLALIHPEDRERYRSALRNLSKTKDHFEITCRTTTRKGKPAWVRTSAQLLRHDNGKPAKIRAFVHDMSRYMAQERALETAMQDAVSASKAKSEFLANMSHEIRTPMNGVLGMAELLEQTDITDRQRDYIKVINSSSQALLTIINDILDFSKIEAGAFQLDPVPFNLRDAIDDVTTLLSTKCQEKGLEIIVDYAPELPRHFIGDGGRIRQVLTNLVSNAVKFTDEGHVLITADITPGQNDQSEICITIKDTGIGIEAAKLSDVFNKFTQADGSTTRVYGGTGLGLTISKHITELMEGNLNASSVLGEGSEFSLSLSLPTDPNAKPTLSPLPELKGLKALIVDDIDINRDILQTRFESWGLETVSAADGIDALYELKSAQRNGTPFDLIVLDYLMPGLNGQELAAMITANENLRGIPMVMLSSCDAPISTQDMNEIGIIAHMVKPVREKRLLETLKQAVQYSEERRPTNVSTAVEPIAREIANVSQISADAVSEIQSALSMVKHAKSEDAPIPIQSETHNTPADDNPVKRPVNILVAEDFPLNQDVVRLMLDETHYEPYFTNNGKEAVAVFKANPGVFEAILMDISMPVMDGYEASEIIHAYQMLTGQTPVPIIALTGHALKNDREKCLEASMSDYLTKPVKQLDLLEVLDKWTSVDTGEIPAEAHSA